MSDIAHDEGFLMLDKLISTFKSGENKFLLKGEALFSVQSGSNLIGIGGLNIDPYFTDLNLGRVRHLYVHPKFRKIGVGKLITQTIEELAVSHFKTLQLYTTSEAASKFYQRMGYQLISDSPKVSHAKQINS